MSGLLLRKVKNLPAGVEHAYRVVYDGVEIGSIGLQFGAHQRRYWSWGIDTVVEKPKFAIAGEARDRDDAMDQFAAVWDVFASDPDRLARFLELKEIAGRFSDPQPSGRDQA